MEQTCRNRPSVVLAALLVCTVQWHLGSAATLQRDVNALYSLKSSFSQSLALANWNGNDPCGQGWTGVTCSGLPGSDSIVTSLHLAGLNIGGTFSDQINKLANLTVLDLSNNPLTGNIPGSTGSLKQLQYLYLNATQLSGALPASLGDLPNLLELRLDGCRFTGSLPYDLVKLSQLQRLYLNDNAFTGDVPYDLGNIKTLLGVFLQNNNFTGRIPNFFGGAANLQIVAFYNNSLTGSIPSELGNVKQLRGLPKWQAILVEEGFAIDTNVKTARSGLRLPAEVARRAVAQRVLQQVADPPTTPSPTTPAPTTPAPTTPAPTTPAPTTLAPTTPAPTTPAPTTPAPTTPAPTTPAPTTPAPTTPAPTTPAPTTPTPTTPAPTTPAPTTPAPTTPAPTTPAPTTPAPTTQSPTTPAPTTPTPTTAASTTPPPTATLAPPTLPPTATPTQAAITTPAPLSTTANPTPVATTAAPLLTGSLSTTPSPSTLPPSTTAPLVTTPPLFITPPPSLPPPTAAPASSAPVTTLPAPIPQPTTSSITLTPTPITTPSVVTTSPVTTTPLNTSPLITQPPVVATPAPLSASPVPTGAPVTSAPVVTTGQGTRAPPLGTTPPPATIAVPAPVIVVSATPILTPSLTVAVVTVAPSVTTPDPVLIPPNAPPLPSTLPPAPTSAAPTITPPVVTSTNTLTPSTITPRPIVLNPLLTPPPNRPAVAAPDLPLPTVPLPPPTPTDPVNTTAPQPTTSLPLPPPPPSSRIVQCPPCRPGTALRPLDTACDCVLPMIVNLDVSSGLNDFLNLVGTFVKELSEGLKLDPSQVQIIGLSTVPPGASTPVGGRRLLGGGRSGGGWRRPLQVATAPPPDSRLQVETWLLPLTGLQLNDTEQERVIGLLRGGQVALNQTLFGDYAVSLILRPGELPPPPPPGMTGAPIRGAPPGRGGTQMGGLPAQGLGTTGGGSSDDGGMSAGIIVVIVLAAVAAAGVCLGGLMGFWIWKSRRAGRSKEKGSPLKDAKMSNAFAPSELESNLSGFSAVHSPYSGSAREFSYQELEEATNRFSVDRILGEGGFGQVFRGKLADGTDVAVKKLTREGQQGHKEFLAEVEMLSRLHHRHLVQLIGFHSGPKGRLLAYELVSNGSVESHLHGPQAQTEPLDWESRIKIALGAARGLAYLHEDSNPRVIHRDFKASNILLDQDYTAKVSDFGLAKAAPDSDSGHISTRVMGTFGYVAPEYAMTGHLLVKSDVYSYGVVLLELLSGRKPVDMAQPPGQENLVTFARPLLTTRVGLERLIDPGLEGQYNFDDCARVAAIASMCVQPEVSHRPFMVEVVQALKLVYQGSETATHVSQTSQDLSNTGLSKEFAVGQGNPDCSSGPQSSVSGPAFFSARPDSAAARKPIWATRAPQAAPVSAPFSTLGGLNPAPPEKPLYGGLLRGSADSKLGLGPGGPDHSGEMEYEDGVGTVPLRRSWPR